MKQYQVNVFHTKTKDQLYGWITIPNNWWYQGMETTKLNHFRVM